MTAPALRPCKTRLPSGVTLLTDDLPRAQSVALGVWVPVGSRHEVDGPRGIAHVLEHMVFKGTGELTAQQLALELDHLGGHCDAFTSKEFTAFELKVLAEQLPRALALLLDLVLAPALRPDDLASEKNVILDEFRAVEDNPHEIVHERALDLLYPNHPMGRPILGRAEDVARLRPADLSAFHRLRYRPSSLILAAAGPLEGLPLAAMVEDAVCRRVRAAGGVPSSQSEALGTPRFGGGTVIDRRETEQVHLCLAFPAWSASAPERYAAMMLNTALGGSLGSRLFQEIRERQGLAYAISSSLALYSDTGYLTIDAACAPSDLPHLLETLASLLGDLRHGGLTRGELERAKQHFRTGFLLGMEGTTARMETLARHELIFRRFIPPAETLARVAAVTREEVGELAARLLDPDALVCAFVGPLDEAPGGALVW